MQTCIGERGAVMSFWRGFWFGFLIMIGLLAIAVICMFIFF